jgi:hypothetical protein
MVLSRDDANASAELRPGDNPEPIARWENEGGACDERERPRHQVEAMQDGHATTRE